MAPFSTFASTSVGSGILYRPDMTVSMCGRICALGRFRYFALQATAFCSCDSTYGSHGSAAEADCYQDCAGNASEKCGGPYRNSIYENVYQPVGSKFTKAASSSNSIVKNAGQSILTHWNDTSPSANSQIKCAATCQRNPTCLGYTFGQSSRICWLTTFALAPPIVAGESAWIWMRN
uniref:WSC domain-containing protein n=1 Tax=Macrostomum lignano TaxID=282301 RepID=A0A1I8II33_9PLAT